MLVIEYKVKAKPYQYKAIEEAIRTVQFVRKKCLSYWMDAPKDRKINGFALNNYSTKLREEFSFVKDLNSMAVKASAERGWAAISRFYKNCKNKQPGKKGFPRFQKNNRSVEYKTSGWSYIQTKRRITITDKKGIGELKLLGKWDIHTYPIKSIKRVRLVKRADGYYCQFAIDAECFEAVEPTGKSIGLDVGENAAINLLNLALQARGGHPQSNAVGVGVTTLVGETLLEQTLTLSTESLRP